MDGNVRSTIVNILGPVALMGNPLPQGLYRRGRILSSPRMIFMCHVHFNLGINVVYHRSKCVTEPRLDVSKTCRSQAPSLANKGAPHDRRDVMYARRMRDLNRDQLSFFTFCVGSFASGPVTHAVAYGDHPR